LGGRTDTKGDLMTDEYARRADKIRLREQALARWDNEGGAEPEALRQSAMPVPELSNAELVQLRVRVIALENLVIALLADASELQVTHVREMAALIAPRPGRTQHPLTIDAASHMLGLVHRAGHFRVGHEVGQ
jgi:hypothetical protein